MTNREAYKLKVNSIYGAFANNHSYEVNIKIGGVYKLYVEPYTTYYIKSFDSKVSEVEVIDIDNNEHCSIKTNDLIYFIRDLKEERKFKLKSFL